VSMEYPEPCALCAPSGGTHRLIEKDGVEVSDRCTCARGQMLRRADERRQNPPDPGQFRPTLSTKAATQAARALSQMIPDAPRGVEGVTMLADELMCLCRNVSQAQWLVKRMTRLYSKWPGIREMRIVFCSRFMAADGVDLMEVSAHYPQGIPSDRPSRLVEAPARLALGSVSNDGALNAEVLTAARAKRLASPKRVVNVHAYTEKKEVNG